MVMRCCAIFCVLRVVVGHCGIFLGVSGCSVLLWNISG